MGKYFPDTARHAKAQEFLELKQGVMMVMDYVARFTELARFADDYVATDMAKFRRFENGLLNSLTFHRCTHKHNNVLVDQGGTKPTFGCDELVCIACGFTKH